MDMVVAKQRQITTRVALIAIGLALAAAASGRWPVAIGVLIGGCVAILNFRLLANSIQRLLLLPEPGAARIRAFISYCLRYTVYIGVLYAVTLNPEVDIYATVVGILLVKAVILAEAIIQFVRVQASRLLSVLGERGD